MIGDETIDAYLNFEQEYSDTLAAIGAHVLEKDLVMLVVSGLRVEYNGPKSTIIAQQCPTAFTALLSDHDFMLVKTQQPSVQAFHTTQEPIKSTNDLVASFLATQPPLSVFTYNRTHH